jgi:hypothetical protein
MKKNTTILIANILAAVIATNAATTFAQNSSIEAQKTAINTNAEMRKKIIEEHNEKYKDVTRLMTQEEIQNLKPILDSENAQTMQKMLNDNKISAKDKQTIIDATTAPEKITDKYMAYKNENNTELTPEKLQEKKDVTDAMQNFTTYNQNHNITQHDHYKQSQQEGRAAYDANKDKNEEEMESPCAVVVCLIGGGGSACRKALRKYAKIVEHDKWGTIDWPKTIEKRANFTKMCKR